MTTKGGPVNAERLKSFIERVEKLLEERAAIGGDIRDVFAEAKGVGYDVKTMRSLVRLRTMDAADRAEQEALLDTYAHALGIEISSQVVTIRPSEDDLMERATRIVGEVDRCMALVREGALPKIEAIKELFGCSAGKAHKLRGMVEKRLGQFSLMNARHRENENEIRHDADGVIEDAAPQPDDRSTTPQPAPKGGVGAGTIEDPAPEEITPKATPADNITVQDACKEITPAEPIEMPDLPSFLDRRVTA